MADVLFVLGVLGSTLVLVSEQAVLRFSLQSGK
jgi:hypothetical protein